jgi:hypothetical protein
MIHCLERAVSPRVEIRRSDAEIQLAVRVEQRLQYLMYLSVRALICGNQLQLFGRVASWYQKQQAQEIAREMAPEYQIRNELRVSVS